MGQADSDTESFVILVIQLDIIGDSGAENMQSGIVGAPLLVGETVKQHF